ncbi:hypothetical protein ACCO45_009395 [Purpureocillium lilacinum]|uniref:Uncharacterized protein n=1 Tax=Purpureocillium lilacinum TaxID=33203 RepID=A0ACC4DLW6_PURLI
MQTNLVLLVVDAIPVRASSFPAAVPKKMRVLDSGAGSMRFSAQTAPLLDCAWVGWDGWLLDELRILLALGLIPQTQLLPPPPRPVDYLNHLEAATGIRGRAVEVGFRVVLEEHSGDAERVAAHYRDGPYVGEEGLAVGVVAASGFHGGLVDGLQVISFPHAEDVHGEENDEVPPGQLVVLIDALLPLAGKVLGLVKEAHPDAEELDARGHGGKGKPRGEDADLVDEHDVERVGQLVRPYQLEQLLRLGAQLAAGGEEGVFGEPQRPIFDVDARDVWQGLVDVVGERDSVAALGDGCGRTALGDDDLAEDLLADLSRQLEKPRHRRDPFTTRRSGLYGGVLRKLSRAGCQASRLGSQYMDGTRARSNRGRLGSENKGFVQRFVPCNELCKC